MSEIYSGFMLFAFSYFFLQKRQFDFFSLAFVGVLIYSYPLFFGETTLSPSFNEFVHYQIQPEVYASFGWVLLVILMFSIYYDVKHGGGQYVLSDLPLRDNKASVFIYVVFFISVVSLFLLVSKLRAENLLYESDKHSIMRVLGTEFYLYQTVVLMGYTVSLLRKKIPWTVFFASLALFHVYMQFRTLIFGIIVISAIVFFIGKRERLAIRRWYLGVTACSLLFALYSMKGVVERIKSGADLGDILSYLNRKLFNQFASFLSRQSEPQIIVSSFVETINNNVYLSIEYISTNILNFLPFARSLFGLEVERFNQFIQPLFPSFRGGIASNFLAEAYSFSPLWMMFVGVVLGLGVYFSNWFFYKSTHSILLKSFFLVNAPYMTLYIYRNDMSFVWGGLQRNLIVFTIIMFITFMVVVTLRAYAAINRSGSNLENVHG